MIIKWKTYDWWGDRIDRVECTRETNRCVWIAYKAFKGEMRHLKKSVHQAYHDTWEDAHSYLIEQAKFKIQEQQKYIHQLQDYYDKVVKMEKSEE
jgi:hypothetical protein